ncbi:MAG: HAMP domain-containing protein [Acidobacteria bacterium]|nr:HAMP domain-containing protein [Acidobacteriota bacterium]
MRLSLTPIAWRNSLALQVSLVCWLVALLTLSIFVAGIIPEQKKDLQDALFSKARGVASSLQDVTAGAAVSEDYSSVVDQCNQVLAGDEAIDYLVVTKNDGFSVLVQRTGWRTDHLGTFWRPASGATWGAITTVPDIRRRVFHFAKPFDYSAIRWGWINVGLSLTSYDQSVRRIYWRTGGTAILCVILSLLVSVTYARRQVRPILSLQAAVHQVAQGNLSARAEIHTGNEIEGLANSFNSMTASILQRNEILESVRFAAQEFLAAHEMRAVVVDVLRRIGTATRASHVWMCEAAAAPRAGCNCHIRHEWDASGLARSDNTVSTLRHCRWSGSAESTCAEGAHSGLSNHDHKPHLVQLHAQEGASTVQAYLTVPIIVRDARIGFLGVDDCTCRREWSTAEQDCFRAVAGMIGASITRQQALEALQEAKETLEARVVERTRELQEEVFAKDRAHRELAEAQQNLIRLSRLSGMAEIATSVLHNVGNVLNSVNVSTTVVSDKVRELRADNLASATALLQQHQDEISDFIRRDPKGQRVLPYLVKLGTHFQDERQTLLQELEQLRKHVEHIKGIVSTQQNYAKVSGMVEDVNLPELVDDACRILQTGFERHHISIERDYEAVPELAAEKHAVLQILLNLIRNAKEAIKQADSAQRLIRIRIRRHADSHVRVEVIDTGVGIEPQNLTRIFSHGFTTKPSGHGFGLHTSALDARKMGGSLSAASDGQGRGATFTLDLPLHRRDERSVA